MQYVNCWCYYNLFEMFCILVLQRTHNDSASDFVVKFQWMFLKLNSVYKMAQMQTTCDLQLRLSELLKRPLQKVMVGPL